MVSGVFYSNLKEDETYLTSGTTTNLPRREGLFPSKYYRDRRKFWSEIKYRDSEVNGRFSETCQKTRKILGYKEVFILHPLWMV